MSAPDSYRADIPAEVNNFYDNVLLMRALPANIHGLFGQRKNIPANFGSKIIKFRRYSSLSAASTLTDGVTPTGSSLAVTDITATALQYGDFTRISDVVTTESPDPILTEASEILGEQMGLTNDGLCATVLGAGTVVQYASSATARATVVGGMTLNGDEVKEAVRTLKVANASKITSISGANPGAGTVPINACFIGIVHPNTSFDLKADPLFVPVEKYASNVPLLPFEIGKIDEVRFVETTNAKTFSSTITVYGTVILAANAYGCIDLANSQGSGVIYKGLGSAGSADPLNQRQTLGWKEYYVCKILNDSFMVRIEHAVTA
jgi:N4-gp56 family major capsid protein